MKNYIVLSGGFEWCYYCWKDYVATHDNVRFYRYRFPLECPQILIKIIKKIYHPKGYCFLRPLIRPVLQYSLPLKKGVENVVIFYDWNYLPTDKKYLDAIRKKDPQVKLVYVFTNIVRITGANRWGILDKLNEWFDAVFAFDPLDAKRYGFHYNRLIYTTPKLDSGIGENIDLFYIGKAKDRLDSLIEIFEQAQREGLKCDFTIVDVPEGEQRHAEVIKYNVKLPYGEVIEKIKRSRCLVDVIQGESNGLTIKTVESVVYDKKLLTTNENVKEEEFYKTQNILIYDKRKSIKDFLDIPLIPNTQKEKSVFSPDYLFRMINQFCK